MHISPVRGGGGRAQARRRQFWGERAAARRHGRRPISRHSCSGRLRVAGPACAEFLRQHVPVQVTMAEYIIYNDTIDCSVDADAYVGTARYAYQCSSDLAQVRLYTAVHAFFIGVGVVLGATLTLGLRRICVGRPTATKKDGSVNFNRLQALFSVCSRAMPSIHTSSHADTLCPTCSL